MSKPCLSKKHVRCLTLTSHQIVGWGDLAATTLLGKDGSSIKHRESVSFAQLTKVLCSRGTYAWWFLFKQVKFKTHIGNHKGTRFLLQLLDSDHFWTLCTPCDESPTFNRWPSWSAPHGSGPCLQASTHQCLLSLQSSCLSFPSLVLIAHSPTAPHNTISFTLFPWHYAFL